MTYRFKNLRILFLYNPPTKMKKSVQQKNGISRIVSLDSEEIRSTIPELSPPPNPISI